jgi:TRAP-type C4-dicarboxylate transport system substrate-binding protein
MTALYKSVLLAAALANLCAASALADPLRLIMTSMSPPASPNSVFFASWAKRVNEQSKGTLNVEVRDGITLANFPNVIDRVTDDVVQIGWAIHDLVGGRFPLTEVADLPLLADTTPHGAVALWRLYKTGLLDSEYKGLHPLFFTINGLVGLHFAKQPKGIDDLKGLKVRIGAKIQSSVIERLGGAPISLPSDDMYPALQRGTIDAVLTTWGAFGPYKLLDVTSYHVETPLGATTSMFFMANAKYDALPAPAKAALDANSGESATLAWAQQNEEQARINRDQALASPKQKVVRLEPAQLARWQQAIDPVIAEWTSARPTGATVLATYRKLLADIDAGR